MPPDLNTKISLSAFYFSAWVSKKIGGNRITRFPLRYLLKPQLRKANLLATSGEFT